jgi:hypothetical protein
VRLPLERVLATEVATHEAPGSGARVQQSAPAAAAASPLSNSGRR